MSPSNPSPAREGHGAVAASETAPPAVAPLPSTFARAPLRERVYLVLTAVVAVVLALWLAEDDVSVDRGALATAGVLLAVSVLNVELSRALSGGLEHSQQPHKALSAWAFAGGLMLPTPWLLVIVPLTYAHARWRGIRVPLWKWVGSGFFLVLAGTVAAAVKQATVGADANWMAGDGGEGVVVILAAAAAFLVVETALFAGSALLNWAHDEVWLRHTLRSRAFYATEAGVLLVGGLLAAVWTGGPWFVLLFLPIYALAQRAVLHEPLREKAGLAAEVARKNEKLEAANQFKIDVMGMLVHEIGNPLASVQGYAEVGGESLRKGDTAHALAAFEVVDRNARQISGVVQEVGSLVGSGSAAFSATPEPCRLLPHLHAAAAAQPPGSQPEADCPGDLIALVQPGHLDQVLANLLSNATKYAGGATTVAARPRGADGVEVSVVDAGTGVPEQFRTELFRRFSRGPATAGDVVGTGIGLFISRELARANGGDLTYRDAPDGGACFVLTLRRTTPA
ncbi:ATP-binding protein [Nocardioides sp. SYSU DS0663]|uniref:ATP-binding protein n=1 Tax=Nocardioides sp. SYSU DS0663 TaxID=3416445 RepID=UPI003F4B2C3B